MRLAFTLLVLAVAAQRLWEVRRSGRHERELLARGGREHAPEQMRWMRAVHALWLAGCLAECWLAPRTPPAWLLLPAAAAFLEGQLLRLLAMRELGPRWTVKVMTLPEAPLVAMLPVAIRTKDDDVGVCLELAALPLLGGAYATAIAATLANAILLRFRIAAEDAALGRTA